MLATQKCGRRCMLLPHAATWAFAAISANSQLIHLLPFCKTTRMDSVIYAMPWYFSVLYCVVVAHLSAITGSLAGFPRILEST